MMRDLDSQQLSGVLECVHRLYEPMTAQQFGTHLVGLIDGMVDGAKTAFDEIEVATGAYRLSHSFPFNGKEEGLIFQRLTEVYMQHPIFAYVRGGGRELVVNMEDMASPRNIRLTDLYQDVFKPAGIEHQLCVQVPIRGWVISLSVNRDTPFDPSAESILRHLAPHIVRAHGLAGLRDARLVETPLDEERFAAAGLSAREFEVLSWLERGKRNAEIAQILGVSPRTVEKHVQTVMRKLDAETRTAAARLARELCLPVTGVPGGVRPGVLVKGA